MSDPTIPPNDPAATPPPPPTTPSSVPPPPVDYASPMTGNTGGLFAAPLVPGAIVTDPNARTWGLIAHLSAFATLLLPSLGNIIGPLVVWLIKKDEIPFAADQAKEALNFNITWSIILWLSFFTFCIGVGFVLVPLIVIFMIVITIIAAVKANNGEWYRYPMTIRFVK